MLMAHCDDEFLFGFSVIHNAKKIISCTDDKTHPTRQWCNKRSDAFKIIGDKVGAETVVLRHDSGFASRTNKYIRDFTEDVRRQISDADIIFTHNGWGEYGHLDHILLHQIARMSGKQVITTDIALDADWYKVIPYSQGQVIEHCFNDLDSHEKCMQVYRDYGAMGWTYPPIKECKLIEIKQ